MTTPAPLGQPCTCHNQSTHFHVGLMRDGGDLCENCGLHIERVGNPLATKYAYRHVGSKRISCFDHYRPEIATPPSSTPEIATPATGGAA